ncbi:MAG: hypothetical protein OXH57_10660 [Ekhidna sp.]|nr:hypothetical protein [Ekhidna sp.]
MKNLRLTLSFILPIILLLSANAQESLQEEYDYLIRDTETYEHYKVIPKTRLDQFWALVIDSVSVKNQEISNLKIKLSYEQKVVGRLKAEADQFQRELNDSLTQNSSINFFGLSLSKSSYQMIVWAIIIILILVAGFAYSMYFRSNRLTVLHRKRLEEVELEYEQHRTYARDRQVKLKRELQTAINKLESEGKSVS